MNRIALRLVGIASFATFLMVAVLSLPARAGTTFDYLFSMSHVSNDREFFLNLAVSDYRVPRPVLEPMIPRMKAIEDDLPVVLFLARESGRPMELIVDLRARGISWGAIFKRCRVTQDVLFVGIDRDPGPPYGRAWGFWKKHGKRVYLTDRDIRGLAHLQVGYRVLGVTPYELARVHAAGRPVYVYVAEKKGRPYRQWPRGQSGEGSGREEVSDHDDGHREDHGRGGDHGRGHDKHEDHGRDD